MSMSADSTGFVKGVGLVGVEPADSHAEGKVLPVVAGRVVGSNLMVESTPERMKVRLVSGQNQGSDYVPAEPGSDVRCPEGPAKNRSEGFERPVPRVVTELVVDCLETVEVEKYDTDLLTVPARRPDHLISEELTTPAIVETGEGVSDRDPLVLEKLSAPGSR